MSGYYLAEQILFRELSASLNINAMFLLVDGCLGCDELKCMYLYIDPHQVASIEQPQLRDDALVVMTFLTRFHLALE